MHDPRNWESLVVPFSQAVCKMSDQSLQVLSKSDYFHVILFERSIVSLSEVEVVSNFE